MKIIHEWRRKLISLEHTCRYYTCYSKSEKLAKSKRGNQIGGVKISENQISTPIFASQFPLIFTLKPEIVDPEEIAICPLFLAT